MRGRISGRWLWWGLIVLLVLVGCAGTEEIPTPEGDMPAEWEIYQDETYDFEVPYPADWTVREADIGGAAEVPMERVLNFWPPEYQTGVPPVSIEVARGTQDLMTMWPILGTNAYTETVLYEKEVWIAGGVRGDVFYILRDPADSELWVAIRDSITFSPGDETRETVDRMVEGFQFTE